jgi:hypothetical protein
VRPDGVVVVAPKSDFAAGLIKGVGDLLVQQRVAQAAIEALDEGVLLWLAGLDAVPGDVILLCSFQDGAAVNPVPLSLTMQAGLP